MKERIRSLDHLVEVLPTCSGQDFVEIACRLAIPQSDFEPYAHWSTEKYTRNCIDRTERYELLLLCWEKGLETPVHCHGGEECWVHMVSGKIKEIRVKERLEGGLITESEEVMEEGDISYMNDQMGFHSLHNLAAGRSMSLHLYMNPIDRCRIYNKESESFQYKDLCYDTYKGKRVTEGVPAFDI